jgi:cell fate (sporulation/competence/biofilm development) regulator YlbF (YheA/YmcA/DUF963 family)
MMSLALLALGLLSPGRPPCTRSGAAVAASRRMFTSALLSSAALSIGAPDAQAYRTVQQAMEDTRQVSQESALYARFGVVKDRMSQLSEFGELADKAEWDKLQAFARNYNQLVQNDEMLKIVDMLSGPAKEEAKKYATLVKNDLKAIDKAAREKDGARAKDVVPILTSNLNEFLKLRPEELKEKYSVPDL